MSYCPSIHHSLRGGEKLAQSRIIYISSIIWLWQDLNQGANHYFFLWTGILSLNVEFANIDKPPQNTNKLNITKELYELLRQDATIILDDNSNREAVSVSCIKFGQFIELREARTNI